MPMHPAMPTPPGPGFRGGFPLRMPGPPPRMPGLPRLPPGGPAARLPPKMPPPPSSLPPPLPPPPLPPPRPPRSAAGKQLPGQKRKQQIRNGITERAINSRLRRNGSGNNRNMPKVHKEQDFTVDTFEENLLTTSTTGQLRRSTKGRYSQAK